MLSPDPQNGWAGSVPMYCVSGPAALVRFVSNERRGKRPDPALPLPPLCTGVLVPALSWVESSGVLSEAFAIYFQPYRYSLSRCMPGDDIIIRRVHAACMRSVNKSEQASRSCPGSALAVSGCQLSVGRRRASPSFLAQEEEIFAWFGVKT